MSVMGVFIFTFNSFVKEAINLTCAIGKDRGHILLRLVKLIANLALIFIALNYFAEVIEKKNSRVRF